MKTTITFFLFLILALFSNSQIGSTCNQAELVLSGNSCNYSIHTTSSSEYWLKFTATSPTINVSLMTTKFGLNATHIHSLNLISGNCSNPIDLAVDELPHVDEAKELSIDLNASNLVIGQEYYLLARRHSVIHGCDKTSCSQNGSTDPTTFSICVENIEVIIPPDFNDEKPVSSFALETNRGQLTDTDGNLIPEIKLFNDKSNPAIFITEDNLSYVFSQVDQDSTHLQRVDMDFLDGNKNCKVFKMEEVSGVSNYYLPHIPNGVIGNRSYSRSVINDIYSGIDLQYYSNINGAKYYFTIDPTGNPDDIVMEFNGATGLTIGSNGELIISSLFGSIEFESPHMYQTISSNVIPIGLGSYQIVDSFKVKFVVPNYVTSQNLFIQLDQGHTPDAPKAIENLNWSTFYGSSSRDEIFDLDTDNNNGDVYFVGFTNNLNFPSTSSTVVITSNADKVIAGSHRPLGERKWATIYGANGIIGESIATDDYGNVYITGYTFGEANSFIAHEQIGAYNQPPPA